MENEYLYEIVMNNGLRVRKIGKGNENKIGKQYDSFEKAVRCIVSKIAQEGICFNQVRIAPEIENMLGFKDIYYGEIGRYIAAKLGLKEQGENPAEKTLEAIAQ